MIEISSLLEYWYRLTSSVKVIGEITKSILECDRAQHLSLVFPVSNKKLSKILKSTHHENIKKITVKGFTANQLLMIFNKICDKKINNHIKTINIIDCDLSKWPDSIFSLTELVSVYILNSKLSYIDPGISSFTKLEELSICNNENLGEIPDFITRFSSLKYLCLDNNSIVALPEGLGNLKKLEFFSVSQNKLKTLPDSFSELQNLITCNVSSNQLYFLPKSNKKLKSLTDFNCEYNHLMLTIPTDWVLLKKLNFESSPLTESDFNERKQLFLFEHSYRVLSTITAYKAKKQRAVLCDDVNKLISSFVGCPNGM